MNKKVMIVLLLLIPVIVFVVFRVNDSKYYLNSEYYKKGEFIKVTSKELSKIDDENYILFTYNNYCTFPKPCEEIFESFMRKYKISFLSIPFDEFKKTKYYKKVKYAPTVIIVRDGKIVSYLDANIDDDFDKYQDVDAFTDWMKKFMYVVDE